MIERSFSCPVYRTGDKNWRRRVIRRVNRTSVSADSIYLLLTPIGFVVEGLGAFYEPCTLLAWASSLQERILHNTLSCTPIFTI